MREATLRRYPSAAGGLEQCGEDGEAIIDDRRVCGVHWHCPAAEVKLDVGRFELRPGSDERASLGEAGRERSTPLVLEQRDVLWPHCRASQALVIGKPHEPGEWVIVEVVTDRQIDPRLDP